MDGTHLRVNAFVNAFVDAVVNAFVNGFRWHCIPDATRRPRVIRLQPGTRRACIVKRALGRLGT